MTGNNLNPKNLLLDYYHCTFFLPLTGLKDEDFKPALTPVSYHSSNAAALSAEQAQAYRYFSPALRNILFDTSDPQLDNSKSHQQLIPVKEWRLPIQNTAWQICLGKEEEKDNPLLYQVARVTSVILYQYFNGIYLLSFRAEPEALVPLQHEYSRVKEKLKQEVDKKYKDEKSKRERKNKQDKWVGEQLDARGCSLFANTGRRPQTIDEIDSADPHKEQYSQLCMESWLRFTRHVRLIYPSFPEQNEEEKIAPIKLVTPEEKITAFGDLQKVSIPDPPGKDISPLIRYLLTCFVREPDKNDKLADDHNTVTGDTKKDPIAESINDLLDHYSSLYDDRMFVSVAYGLAHRELPESDVKRLFCLASYVDQQSDTWGSLDGYAYTPSEILARIEPSTFGLWRGMGGLYGYTAFSNAYLHCGGFFRDIAAPFHIPWIYDRMLQQALFYQASLNYYDERICIETKNLLDEDNQHNLDNVRRQHKDFIRFTNQYWFHSVTRQEQGREIFQLQQQVMGLRPHYEIIKDELDRTHEYLSTAHEISMSRISERFTFWGIVIAILALYYTILPMLYQHLRLTGGDIDSAQPQWHLLSRFGVFNGWNLPLVDLVVIPGVLVLVYLFYFFVKKLKRYCARKRA